MDGFAFMPLGSVRLPQSCVTATTSRPVAKLARRWAAVLSNGPENKNKKCTGSSQALGGVLVIACHQAGQLSPSAPDLTSHNFSTLGDTFDGRRALQNVLKIGRKSLQIHPQFVSTARSNPDNLFSFAFRFVLDIP
jgi:hypothetical protein